MQKNHRELIRDIFDLDKDIKKFCDMDYIGYMQDISQQIILRINKCLREYPSSYIFIDEERKYFAVWMKAHGDNILYSFGVHPDNRDKDNLKLFWEYLENEHDDGFLCYLYSNNTRAIKWLKKNGMDEIEKIVERPDKVAIKLILDKNKQSGTK
jgi:N-acetylglutamate synthase-like GNAT family acetyltransferase